MLCKAGIQGDPMLSHAPLCLAQYNSWLRTCTFVLSPVLAHNEDELFCLSWVGLLASRFLLSSVFNCFLPLSEQVFFSSSFKGHNKESAESSLCGLTRAPHVFVWNESLISYSAQSRTNNVLEPSAHLPHWWWFSVGGADAAQNQPLWKLGLVCHCDTYLSQNLNVMIFQYWDQHFLEYL